MKRIFLFLLTFCIHVYASDTEEQRMALQRWAELLQRKIHCPAGYEIAPERLLLLLQGYPLPPLCVPIKENKNTKN